MTNHLVPVKKGQDHSGKLLLLQSNFLTGRTELLFDRKERKTDICFPYPFYEVTEVGFALPEGWRIEELPAEISLKNEVGVYARTFTPSDNGFELSRVEAVSRARFPRESLQDAREWDAAAYTGDRERVVIRLN